MTATKQKAEERDMATNEGESAEYVVIGPGWGAEYLQPSGPTGRIAYRGPDRARALRTEERCHREIERLRRQPGMRDILDTYCTLTWAGTCWVGVREEGTDTDP